MTEQVSKNKEAVDKIIRFDENNFLLTCDDGWFEIWTCPIHDTNEPNKPSNHTHIRLQGQEVMGSIELHTFLVSGHGIWQKFIHLDSIVELGVQTMRDDNKIIVDYCLPDNEEDAIELIQRGLENIKNDDLAKEKIVEIITDDDPDRIGIDVSEAVHVVWIRKEDFLKIAEMIGGD